MTPTAALPRPAGPRRRTRAAAALDAAFEADRRDPAGRAGAHLADYAFRMGPEPAAAPEPERVAPAAPGTTWTLGETLAEVRRRGARLTVSSRGLRLAHAHRLPDLAAAVLRHEAALTMWLTLGPVPAPFDAAGWDDETRLYAGWLATLAPPVLGRIELRPGHTVVDGRAFRSGLAARLAAGPRHPGADGLRADLAGLYARLGPHAARTAAPARRALAA